MTPRLLLDTHIVVRWLAAPKKLTREQLRALRDAARRCEPVGVSAISLLEMAVLFAGASGRSGASAAELLREIEESPAFAILPLTVEVAAEVAALGPALRDPADRAIVATARVRRLRLVTSDQRILESGLVPVVS